MNEYNNRSFHMENEFETIRQPVSEKPPVTSVPVTASNENRYYSETIKPKKRKGGFVKFVIVAVICAVVAAPLLGLGMGAGQTIAENYFGIGGKEAEQAQNETITEKLQDFEVSKVASSSPTLPVTSNSIVDIVKASKTSVVNITTSVISQDRFFNYYFGGNRESTGSGTGIIFEQDDENVYIMTNYHVIENASRAYVSIEQNEQIPASPVGGNKDEDVAVVYVKKSDLEAEGIKEVSVAKLGDSSNVEVGELVVAIGNAIGNGKTVTYGIVSALNREVGFSDGRKPVNLIQTDAAINQGNSGGALVNMHGEVIGMNTAKLAGYTIEGMGFAIPINSIMDIVDGIMGKKAENMVVDRPFIGISGGSVTKEMVEAYDLIVTEGVFLESVLEGGGASDAGLRQGDIIVEFDGKKIATIEQLQEIIAEQEIGAKVDAKIIRNNEREIEVAITISNMVDVAPW